MKKLFLVMLLVFAVINSGCFGDEPKRQVRPVAPVQQEVKQISFVVYRAAADGSEKLLPEKITMQDNGKTLPENALNALVSIKPQDARMDDVVPIGTKVLSLKIDADGTAYADFSKELAKRSYGSYNEMMLCYAIANTLTEFPEIQRVQIMVEGKKVVSLSGHMDLEDPLTRNESLLNK
ncbi:GerMN domain-containing protein [uncultured Phascolarctobacterium sp.]|uniref:GerMN domain-containing protein n=1 Tax=uncultured Phascolarctobacterium sp. TaxID=512296 RepID=UPI0025FECC45|nr:GerMN domain-containing protein [uncultured Phascolarctobacterium sp.]